MPRGSSYDGMNDWADNRGKRKKQPGSSPRPAPLTPRGPGKPRFPGPGTKPAPLTPRTPGIPGKKRPDMGYGPGRKPSPGNGGGPVRPRPLPLPRKPKKRGL